MSTFDKMNRFFIPIVTCDSSIVVYWMIWSNSNGVEVVRWMSETSKWEVEKLGITSKAFLTMEEKPSMLEINLNQAIAVEKDVMASES
jgi:hypothetical protein